MTVDFDTAICTFCKEQVTDSHDDFSFHDGGWCIKDQIDQTDTVLNLLDSMQMLYPKFKEYIRTWLEEQDGGAGR